MPKLKNAIFTRLEKMVEDRAKYLLEAYYQIYLDRCDIPFTDTKILTYEEFEKEVLKKLKEMEKKEIN